MEKSPLLQTNSSPLVANPTSTMENEDHPSAVDSKSDKVSVADSPKEEMAQDRSINPNDAAKMMKTATQKMNQFNRDKKKLMRSFQQMKKAFSSCMGK